MIIISFFDADIMKIYFSESYFIRKKSYFLKGSWKVLLKLFFTCDPKSSQGCGKNSLGPKID
jgi:hypothetical protein